MRFAPVRTMLAAAMALAIAAPASAVVVGADSEFGLQTVVRDTATHTEWLSLSLTWDLTWNAAETGFATAGFRHATQGELVQLFNDAGLPTDLATSHAAYEPVSSFQSMVSCRWWYAPVPGEQGCNTHGWTAIDASTGRVWMSWLERNDTLLTASAVVDTMNFMDGSSLETYAHPTLGHWMVRAAPIPEPATWALMVAGLAGVGVSARSRRDRQTAEK